jgi:transcriptional regulator with XRE-family HTH domain
MSDRSSELQGLLRQARSRIAPQSVGIGVGGLRRVPGLRREEVAELAGISEVWYARFESGRAMLSVSALDRVAAALQLSREERIRLMLLARPDVRGLTSEALGDSFSGMMSAVAGLRDFAKRCASAASFAELSQYASRAIHETCGDRSAGWVQQYVAKSQEFPFVALCGNDAEVFTGDRTHCDTIPHAMPAFLDGLAFSERDLRESPSAELRGRAEAGFYAYYAKPVTRLDGLHSCVGAAFAEPHVADRLQRHAIEAVAAIFELTMMSWPSGVY